MASSQPSHTGSSAATYSVVSRSMPAGTSAPPQAPKTISDLPLELLSEIASYLGRKDLKSLLLTRKGIHQAVSKELYRNISWVLGRPRFGMPERNQARTSQASGHALVSVLSDHIDLAQHVRHLHLCWEPCISCHPELRKRVLPSGYSPGCGLVLAGFLKYFVNMTSLYLAGDWDKMVAGHQIVPLPRLETLTLLGIEPNWSSYRPTMSIEQVLRNMVHPKLQDLILQRVIVGPFGREDLYNASTLASSLLSVVSLTLDCSWFDTRSLTELLGEFKALRTLNLVRQRQDTYRLVRQRGLSLYRFGDLGDALSGAKNLEKLKLVPEAGGILGEYCKSLTSMSSLHHLRCLVVDPSILIGFRRCPAIQDEEVYEDEDEEELQDVEEPRLPSILASMLPQSLEHVAIAVDWVQAAKVPDYRSFLIEGFIGEKKQGRLRHLVQVVFLELKVHQGYHMECECADDAVSPCPTDENLEGPITFRQMRKLYENEKAWKEVGIQVELIGDEDIVNNTKEWQKYSKTFEW